MDMLTAPDASHGLAMAMIASSSTPLLLLDDDLAVVAASASFCAAFGIAPDGIRGNPLAMIGAGEWDAPPLAALLTATRSGLAQAEAHEMDLVREDRETRCLVLNACKLDYADLANPRLVLTITDVTDMRTADRQKDRLIREKGILVQEIQHRVANSLQIIASVLMQSARRVQSDETRGHLQDAHSRVMSIAALQKQLALSSMRDVLLGTYFGELCRSIAASMIYDPGQLSIEVDCDDSVTGADRSISLGLVVTELVINALKHAFPDHRHGKIIVHYRSHGADWKLSVADDGVGMPPDPESRTPGLGTGIVEALAKQLGGGVLIEAAHPGTRVSVSHF